MGKTQKKKKGKKEKKKKIKKGKNCMACRLVPAAPGSWPGKGVCASVGHGQGWVSALETFPALTQAVVTPSTVGKKRGLYP